MLNSKTETFKLHRVWGFAPIFAWMVGLSINIVVILGCVTDKPRYYTVFLLISLVMLVALFRWARLCWAFVWSMLFGGRRGFIVEHQKITFIRDGVFLIPSKDKLEIGLITRRSFVGEGRFIRIAYEGQELLFPGYIFEADVRDIYASMSA